MPKRHPTEARIAAASKLLGKATAKLYQTDPELAERLTKLLAAEMERVRMEGVPTLADLARRAGAQ